MEMRTWPFWQVTTLHQSWGFCVAIFGATNQLYNLESPDARETYNARGPTNLKASAIFVSWSVSGHLCLTHFLHKWLHFSQILHSWIQGGNLNLKRYTLWIIPTSRGYIEVLILKVEFLWSVPVNVHINI